jgi:hypothetical protein
VLSRVVEASFFVLQLFEIDGLVEQPDPHVHAREDHYQMAHGWCAVVGAHENPLHAYAACPCCPPPLLREAPAWMAHSYLLCCVDGPYNGVVPRACCAVKLACGASE